MRVCGTIGEHCCLKPGGPILMSAELFGLIWTADDTRLSNRRNGYQTHSLQCLRSSNGWLSRKPSDSHTVPIATGSFSYQRLFTTVTRNPYTAHLNTPQPATPYI